MFVLVCLLYVPASCAMKFLYLSFPSLPDLLSSCIWYNPSPAITTVRLSSQARRRPVLLDRWQASPSFHSKARHYVLASIQYLSSSLVRQLRAVRRQSLLYCTHPILRDARNPADSIDYRGRLYVSILCHAKCSLEHSSCHRLSRLRSGPICARYTRRPRHLHSSRGERLLAWVSGFVVAI
ncbi:hypothetical protein BC629DRAFT_1514271 [Irpex lacteus]|nr:hypothetical protein BC629DRAFT_1514271 [Irpex lacteus]